MPWFFFFAASLLCSVLLLSFYPSLRRLGFSRTGSLALSPLVAVVILCVFGIVLDLAGLSVPAYFLVVSLLLFALCVLILSRNASGAVSYDHCLSARQERGVLPLYLAVGLIVCAVFFLLPLNGPDSFVQYSDNVAHLGRAQVMLHDGRFSILSVGNYPLDLSIAELPVDSSRGFYPAGISVLVAVLAGTLHVSVSLCQNIVLFLFMAFVFPAGFCYFFSRFFDGNLTGMVLGAFASMLFAAFPFGLLLYGPLYPNVVSMCCAPAVAAVFMEIFGTELARFDRIVRVVLFFLGSVALCALQPNTVFLLAVLLTPFCCHSIYSWLRDRLCDKQHPRCIAFAGAFMFAAFAVAVWTACFLAPSFQGVVNFRWEHLYEVPYAIWSFVSLGLRRDLPQCVAAVAVLIGFIVALFDKNKRWVSVSYALMGVIYVVGISTEGPLKQYLAGFWYTDPYRTAASVALIAVPLAAFGMYAVFNLIWRLIRAVFRGKLERILVPAAGVFGLGVSLLNLMLPNYGYAMGAFEEVFEELTYLNNYDNDKLLNYGEREFMKRVADITGDSLVINNPFDGSVFSYPETGVNLYFKSVNLGGQTKKAHLIGENLDQYGIDPKVTEAVDETGADYILILDELSYVPMNENLLYSPYSLYPYRHWTGFDSLPQDASRYTVVLDDGLHKLLRINR